MKAARISKIAGVALAGFVVASVTADKANVGPVASQIAGFVGAFVGTLVGRREARRTDQNPPGTGPEKRGKG